MSSFIAVDGEADSRGRYILLCDSLGRVLYSPGGISSSEAFEFLLGLPAKHEIVCYGLNYDANQWLKDLSRPTLERLASEGRAVWRNSYKLEWIPSKMFTVTVPQKSVTVCETFGFFQTSFVKALKQWGLETPAEIETMKGKRGTFTRAELGRVIRYCQVECKLLVEMMEKLQDACREADCVPRRRWIGAGSIASSLLTSHAARAHHVYDADLFGRELTDDYVLRAYYGGRVELYQQGWQNRVIATDIRSAYPFAAMHLPSLVDAEVRRVKDYVPGVYGLWRVTWNIPNQQIAPFPVRLPGGEICYPLAGEGVYHSPEVDLAIECGYPLTVHDGVVLLPREHLQPFAWISDVYQHRAEFKRRDSYAEKALKLGLNSVYGKMAQGYGFGRKPPFQSYFWAGYITSVTRARAMARLRLSRTPVMTATDGIVCTTSRMRDGDTAIGSWEKTNYQRVATVQPGVYVAEVKGERIVKSRGFFARDVDYDDMLEAFEQDSLGCYHFTSRRFIGLKVALHLRDFSMWRQWIDQRRSIAFETRNKRRLPRGGKVLLYPVPGPYLSLPYVPKQSLYDDPNSTEQVENMIRDDQPHREVD